MSMTGTTKLHPGMSRKEAVRAYHAMRDELVRTQAELAELQARSKSLLTIIGNGWEVPDGVEFPIGRVEVLAILPAEWKHRIERWQDDRDGIWVSDVIAYRDTSPPPEAPAP